MRAAKWARSGLGIGKGYPMGSGASGWQVGLDELEPAVLRQLWVPFQLEIHARALHMTRHGSTYLTDDRSSGQPYMVEPAAREQPAAENNTVSASSNNVPRRESFFNTGEAYSKRTFLRVRSSAIRS